MRTPKDEIEWHEIQAEEVEAMQPVRTPCPANQRDLFEIAEEVRVKCVDRIMAIHAGDRETSRVLLQSATIIRELANHAQRLERKGV
jgi:hypothetical protein